MGLSNTSPSKLVPNFGKLHWAPTKQHLNFQSFSLTSFWSTQFAPYSSRIRRCWFHLKRKLVSMTSSWLIMQVYVVLSWALWFRLQSVLEATWSNQIMCNSASRCQKCVLDLFWQQHGTQISQIPEFYIAYERKMQQKDATYWKNSPRELDNKLQPKSWLKPLIIRN